MRGGPGPAPFLTGSRGSACGTPAAAAGGAGPPLFMPSPARSGAVSVGRKRPAPPSSRPGAGDEDEPKRHPGASFCRRVGEAPGAVPAFPFFFLGYGSGPAPMPAAGWPGGGGGLERGHVGRAVGNAPLLCARGEERGAVLSSGRGPEAPRARCARSGSAPAPGVALCHGWNAGPWGGGGGGFP